MSNYEVYLHQKTAKNKRKREIMQGLKENKIEIITFLTFILSLGFIFGIFKGYIGFLLA